MASHSEYLTIHDPPQRNLDHLVIAYGGWPDAAESATNTIKYLLRKLEAKKFAEIDPEEFFVFTQERPRTSRTRDGHRRIHWPANEFYQWTSPSGDNNGEKGGGKTSGLMFLLGMEPNLRWRTFSNIIADLAQEAGIKSVIHVGALLDAVPHTRPVRLTGSSTEPDLQKALDSASVGSSNYQGPTGISTAVMEACTRRGIAYASLWGHTSHYLQAAPNYRISYTLAKSLVTLLDLPIDLTEMRAAANTFDAEVLKAINDDDQLAEYIKKLEDKYDESVTSSDMPEPADVVRELEQFLRSRRISGSEDGN
ncbi:MAG: PAC2 family protein [Chloroflexi bacterium]|nr:PAC2 family protein [Chloroflexota bacterium]